MFSNLGSFYFPIFIFLKVKITYNRFIFYFKFVYWLRTQKQEDMKKQLIIWLISVMAVVNVYGQDERFLVLEFIKVEPNKVLDYLEYKEFLAEVYQQEKKDGHIKGWDFWSLQSGSELEGENFQYVTVTYYDDPVSMMNGNNMNHLINSAVQAFPEMSAEQAKDKIASSLEMRDLAVRSYMLEVAKTDDDFQYKPGILATFDLMKAVEGKFQEYETAEEEIFLPLHQKKINNDLMEDWRFLRTALPTGSEAKSTHLTMNIYRDYIQFFNSMEYEDMEMTDKEQEAMLEGLKSREQKWVYLATLQSIVR